MTDWNTPPCQGANAIKFKNLFRTLHSVLINIDMNWSKITFIEISKADKFNVIFTGNNFVSLIGLGTCPN
jgi:hypothetical protein